MREEKELLSKALAEAWEEVEARLRELAERDPAEDFRMVSVSYDPMPGESIIEELPELPKSSRASGVEVSVRLRVTYERR